MLLSELNAFYMKALLWIPEDHKTVVGRHFLNGFIGFRAVGEVYDYLSSDRWEVSDVLLYNTNNVSQYQ